VTLVVAGWARIVSLLAPWPSTPTARLEVRARAWCAGDRWLASPAVVTTSEEVERAILAAREGDGHAVAVLWRAYQAPLLRYLRGRGVEDAEDISTQVWIDAARGLGGFEGGGDDFRRWLFTIAHRRVVDERRRWARRMSSPVAAPEVSPSADAEFEASDALERALRLVARLPDPMREAVLLRVVADLSVADTARVMGVRPGHARVLVHRGLRGLERMLAEDGDQAVTLWERQTMKGSR
jgi:RNA polymerase sigma-70 factor (ECF subfamily)